MDAREGFFCAAYELLRNPLIGNDTASELEELLAWFRENLTVPKKFSRSKSKGAYRRDTKGLSWFKPDAAAVLDKSRELIFLLQQHDQQIEMLSSERIGYIIYEDEHQVVAEPFADTPR